MLKESSQLKQWENFPGRWVMLGGAGKLWKSGMLCLGLTGALGEGAGRIQMWTLTREVVLGMVKMGLECFFFFMMVRDSRGFFFYSNRHGRGKHALFISIISTSYIKNRFHTNLAVVLYLRPATITKRLDLAAGESVAVYCTVWCQQSRAAPASSTPHHNQHLYRGYRYTLPSQ